VISPLGWLLALLVAQVGQSAIDTSAHVTDGPEPVVVFVSEVVELTIEPDSLRVDGRYRLQFGDMASGGEVGLFYPYPRDPELGGARTVRLAWRPLDDSSWRPLVVREIGRGAGARWQVPVTAGADIEVSTTYRQARLGLYARYIVTTTARWGRSLESARFVIRLPEGCEPEEFSFPFTRCPDEGPAAWCHEATDFLPDRDVMVRWREEE
jgi:hypothetical protein